MITAQGLGSGLDVASIVSQLVVAEGQPATLRLARREASIQSELSALGSFKSSLSTFREAVERLDDVDVFRSRRATSSNEDLFTVSAGVDAVPSSYEVEVLNVAASAKITSQAFSDATDKQLGAGQLIFRSGEDGADDFTITIDAETSTLADIRDAINDNPDNRSVSASIITAEDGARLILTGTKTGEDNPIEIESFDGGLDFLTFGAGAEPGSTMTSLRDAEDARIRVDSFEQSSSSNVFRDIVGGVSINVVDAEPGTIETLRVAYDTGDATSKVREFVTAYNSLVDSLANLTRFDAETGDAGVLLGDTGVRDVSSSLRREVAGGGLLSDGSYRSLTRAGIETDLEGKLNIDEAELTAALGEDFDAVSRLFGGEDGFATRLNAVMDPYLEEGGRIDQRTEGLEGSIDLIADQRTALDLRLQSVEARLLNQFSALDSIVSSLSVTSDFLTAQLSGLPNSQ
ncbi:MAG: flagellar filament capping protein FliD [Gammaproteobacteria bacterium]